MAIGVVVTAMMRTCVRGNDRSCENDESDDSEHDVTNLHGETPRSDIPSDRELCQLDAAYDG